MSEGRLLGVWKVFGRCLKLSGKLMESVWRVSEGCLGGIYKISGDRPSQDVPSQNRPCQVKSRQFKSRQVHSGQVMSGQVESRLADPTQYAFENEV